MVSDRARALVGWGAGTAAFVLLDVVFWPTIEDQQEELQRLIESYPEALLAIFGGGEAFDVASEPGFLDGQLFALMVPVIFLIYSIGFGSGAIAGEEDRRTMELLLANPVSRRRVVLEKVVALAPTLAALSLLLWLAVWITGRAVGMEIGAVRIAAPSLSLFLLAVGFGALALGIGAATGRRGLAIALAAAAAIGAYLLQSLAPLVDWLDPWTRLSPFAHYSSADRLRDGVDLGAAALLLGLVVAFVLAAVASFDRRDLRL